MRLIHATLRPGKVLEVLENGRIKISAPGLFTDQDDLEKLPPVYPFPIGHANSFSCPKKDEEVWVLSLSDNPLQLHWFRKDNFEENDKDLPIGDEAENVEVVVNREYDDSKWATIYFSNGDGWIIREGEDGLINMRNDGSILLKTQYDKRIIDVCEDSIALGTEGKAGDSAMLFKKWKEWLQNDLCDTFFNTFVNVLNANPYTTSAGAGLKPLVEQLKQTGNDIESKHVSIVEN